MILVFLYIGISWRWNEGGLAQVALQQLHDAVGINCKKGTTTENQGEDLKYMSKACMLMIVYVWYITWNGYNSLVEGGSHGIILLLYKFQEYCIVGIDVNLNNFPCASSRRLSFHWVQGVFDIHDWSTCPFCWSWLVYMKNLVTIYGNFCKQMLVLGVQPFLIECNDIKVLHLNECNQFSNLWG